MKVEHVQISANNRRAACLEIAGLLYAPFLLGVMFVPAVHDLRSELSARLKDLPEILRLFIWVFLLPTVLFVCALLANGFLDKDQSQMRVRRAGWAFALFALIYFVGNIAGVKGGIWYFFNLNMLLMLMLTDGVGNVLYMTSRNTSIFLYVGHRLVGGIFALALLSFTALPIWEALDYFAGSYLMFAALATLRSSDKLAIDLRG